MGRKPKTNQVPLSSTEKVDSTTESLKDILEEVSEEERKVEEKKPRGKAGKKIAEQKEKEVFLQSVTGVGSFGLNLIIMRMPNPSPLTQQEKEKFDTVFDNLLYKYAGILKDYQEESAFILVAGMILFPRIISKKEKKKENESTEAT